MNEAGGGDFGDGVVAIRCKRRILLRTGRIVSIFGGTAGLYITGKTARIEAAQQPGSLIEVGAVDQLPIRLEGVSAISNAVEDGSRLHSFEHRVQVGVDKQVGYQYVLARQVLESPCGKPRRCPINILALLQQHAQEVGTNEPARPQHQYWALELTDVGGASLVRLQRIAVWSHCIETAATMEAGSRPHSARWNFCEPYRPETYPSACL